MEDFIKEFEGRITAVEQSAKQAHKRIDNQDKLTESIYSLVTEFKLMREDVNDIKNRVDIIEQKPGKRWDLVTTTIITAITSGVLGYILSIIL